MATPVGEASVALVQKPWVHWLPAWVHSKRRAIISLAVVLLLWEGFSRSGLVNPFLVPPPSVVFLTTLELAGPRANPPFVLWSHIGASMGRLLVGCLLATVAGAALGFLLAASRIAYRLLHPVVSMIMPIPTLALTPILMLILGLNDRTVITVVFLAAFFSVLYNTMVGARSIGNHHKWAILSMGGSRWDILTKVMIPGTLSHTITGVRLGIGYAWRALVAAEMLAAGAHGLGYMIFDAQQYLATEVVYAGVVCIAVLGALLENAILGTVERRTVERWGVVRGA